ncbi:Not1-domain-containing protein [Irpex rosettiformis]|uniref:Not1-domain-containing protein n=1 Tax=Irpex rosettiformis TaxID=378272 RepID=A0ACB8TTY0_9APHY|nr:Not1-domain-containing protein [Irpex rosettiformis]
MDSPANPNIHTIVKAQIVFLLSTLTEENFERNQVEIRSLSEQHGVDTYLHFIRRLIVHSNSRISSTSSSASFDGSTNLPFRLLVQEVQRLAHDPFLADRFRDGVDKGEGDVFRNFDLPRFVERVGLRPLERLVLASSFVAAPARRDLAMQAVNVIRIEFENAVLALCQHPSFDHADLTPNQVAKLMSNLLCENPMNTPVLDATQRQALIMAAQTKYGAEIVLPIMQRILPTLQLPPNVTLVQALIQLGPEITTEPEVTRGILARFDITETTIPNDEQVVDIVTQLARLAAEGPVSCDVGTLVRTLSSLNGQLDWASVIKSFDRPDRQGVETSTLKLLIAILSNCPPETEHHAVYGFWQTWNNSLYQLRLLDALLSLPSDTFNFVTLPGRRVVTTDDIPASSPSIKQLAANVQGHTWNSLDLFEVLVRLADSESEDVRNFIREMLDKAVKLSAEIVHMGLLQVANLPWNEIRREYTQRLLAMFLAGQPNHQLVFMRIWQIEPNYLLTAFIDFYTESSLNITRILDILDQLLEMKPYAFALDVAALSSRREYLNLDKWLADNVALHGSEFLHGIIEFLDTKMESEKQARISVPAVEPRTMTLNPQTIAIFLRVLRNNSNIMSSDDVDECLQVRNSCLQIHPRLMNLTPGSDAEPGCTVVTYSPEIEAEVDNIYKQMYDEHISIDDVINLLQRNKNSNNPHDKEIFSCMLHFLFDEYKFFQSFYPPRELAMTGYLFGSIIQYHLLETVALGVAVRYILDALSCPTTTNLFRFGAQALSRFETRLGEWQPLCHRLLEMPQLLEARPDLPAIIHRAIAQGAEGESNSLDLGPMVGRAPPEPPLIFNSIHPDPTDGEPEEPPEEISDKILFIVNNLAPSNFDSKLADMREQFQEQYSRWFANYLVDQRVSTEPNNHQLYLRFLDALNVKALFKFVLHETFIKSAQLLNSEKTMQASSERTILKNVGAWLGSITLARDHPIKHRNLSFKDLLVEGYDSGRLIVAIPFVCKTLEPCARSNVFRPPNPWLMAVVSLLAELYHFAELKLNLKFEIEVLCKGLAIDLDTVPATTILRSRPLSDAGPQLPDYVNDIDAIPMENYSTNQIQGESQVIPLNPAATDPQRALGGYLEAILHQLSNAVTISPQLAPFDTNEIFKRAVRTAVDRAVREIIVPVVDRSVTIAGISTRELVFKDYATEADETKLRSAGMLMAQKLAGSLALVTCKEPLKSNLTAHIRANLIENGIVEVMSDQVIALLVQDNLDIACQAIEKAARERATLEVEEGFVTAFDARRRHREQFAGQPFWDPSVPHSPFSNALPDPLRIRPLGIQPVQAAVYEDFGPEQKPRVQVTSRPGSTVSYSRNDRFNAMYNTSPGPDSIQGRGMIDHQDAVDQFNSLVKELDAVVVQLPVQSLAVLPANHSIRQVPRQILFLVASSVDSSRTALQISQKIVQLLYKTPSQLGREIYVALLDQLCHTFENVAKEAINWLIYAEDERKYNVPATVALLRSGLISIAQEDQQLAKFLYTDSKATLQTFAASLVRECLSSDPPMASQSQFVYTLEILTQLSQANKVNDEVLRLLDDLRGVRAPPAQAASDTTIARQPSTKPDTAQLREKLFIWFQQWVNIYQRSSTPEKSFVPFINQLTKQGILKVEDLSSFFFRVCAESSVNSYNKCIAAGEFGYAFQALDAMSRLIVYIIKYHGDASGINNDQAKVHYLTKILSIVVLVLANMHEEQGPAFQQKPFFRFFSSLLNDLHAIETSLGPVYFDLLLAIGDTFSSLQPTYFPAFAFSWMSLISHRLFMPKLLMSENRQGWSAFYKLLLALFKFLSPFLNAADLQPASRDLYRGSLRLLLVLLHDFPEFLSEYYFTLCDIIPPRCIQLRNVILSAFPPNIMLPDPHLRNVKFDSIPEMGPIPPILSDFATILKNGDLVTYLDQYLLNRGSPSFLPSLKDRLLLPGPQESNTDAYNLSLINAVVMYIGSSSVAQAKARSGTALFVASDPGVVALQYLATNLDAEGQYHLLSAMVLHLRYPNAHTHWFSSLMLHLFLEVKADRFREITTRVLLERFLVHRPHPWGALVTFIELLSNTKYDFWNQEFIHVAPEVTLLLETVR